MTLFKKAADISVSRLCSRNLVRQQYSSIGDRDSTSHTKTTGAADDWRKNPFGSVSSPKRERQCLGLLATAALVLVDRRPSEICIALQRTSPSLTPLSRRQVSTSGVMLTKPRRVGRLNHSSLR
jgi:hypothetical protein